MAGRHSFAELRARMTPDALAKAEAEAVLLEEDMDLSELRRALKLSQDEIAQTLQVGQYAVLSRRWVANWKLSRDLPIIRSRSGVLAICPRKTGADAKPASGDCRPIEARPAHINLQNL
jgi:DNA-binding transcriptional regulator YiaG